MSCSIEWDIYTWLWVAHVTIGLDLAEGWIAEEGTREACGLYRHSARHVWRHHGREHGCRRHCRERGLSTENDAVHTKLGAGCRHLVHHWTAHDGKLLAKQRVGVQCRRTVFRLCNTIVPYHRPTRLNHLFISTKIFSLNWALVGSWVKIALQVLT